MSVQHRERVVDFISGCSDIYCRSNISKRLRVKYDTKLSTLVKGPSTHQLC